MNPTRRLRATRSLLTAAIAAGGLAAAATPASAAPTRYLLSLGDSLAQGFQPDAHGKGRETNEGYADQLYATLRRQIPGLRLVKLGCPGDTTTSMRTGHGNEKSARVFHCDRKGGSQLTAAERFLEAHHARGEVALITLDIGANDVDGCTAPGVSTFACVAAGLKSIKQNTPPILKGIKRAAAAGTPFAAMNLYDPVLSLYFSASSSQRGLAAASVALLKLVNGEITQADRHAKVMTADVAAAFASYNQRRVSYEGTTIPEDVARVCAWTWACTTPPVGPNIHANELGYGVIAQAFRKVIGAIR